MELRLAPRLLGPHGEGDKGFANRFHRGDFQTNAELRRQWCCDSDWGSSTSMAPLETGMASGESAIFDLLDSSAGKDVKTLRAVVRVRQPVLGAQHFDDALEVIAEQTLTALDAA
jgi:hypothetical protein